jgi:inhibitor of cysteine peptidase
MSRNNFILAALAAVLLLVTACSSPKSVTLTSTNNGGKVEVQVGGQIIIKLDGNPSTGYTWEAKDLYATLFKQVGDPVFSSSSPGLVGSGGTLTLTFNALKAGASQLTLIYHRPWETGVDPINTFTVTVTVK